MRRIMTAAEAKTHFSESIRSAESGDLVVITRYGKPVAALVGAEHVEQFERLPSSSPEEGLAGLVGLFDDGREFAEEVERLVERRSH